MDEQTLSLIPASEEDLQYLNPEPQPINLVPASQEDLQYITPVLQQPTMLDMTADFETFKAFRKAGAFDSQKSIGESIVESGAGMLSDFWQSAKTLPVRFASNFLFLDKINDIYKPLGKVRTQAKATSLQTYGNLELDYKQLTSAIVRGVQKPFLEDESEEDLKSSYEFFRTQAELEHQRQGKAAEMVTEGFLGMSPEFLTLGMPEEEREQIRTQQVMPDMAAARGATMTGDPVGLLPLGSAFRLATGTGRQVLRGAEKALLNETMDLAKLQVNMKQALNRIGDNTVKSRRLAIKQAPARARLEKGLAEVTEKIAENKAKLKPLAAKRDMALTDIASKLPANHPLKEFLNESLKDVPVKQPLNLLNKAGGATLIGLAKPVEFLGNALQFIRTLPQETAINMLMKAGEKAGVEVTEQQANLLIKSGVVGGVGYGGYQFSEQFTDSEVGKLGGALSFLLGPQFLSRFGRNTAILGREIMKPTSDMAFFSRLASKDAEKLTTQLIDRTAILPVSSVARKVTGAAEGKVMSRMAGKEAFGNMSQGGQVAVNFLDRTGLGRYVETAGRLAKGAGVGGAVGGAFGLAASGGGDMPEAIYGGIGAGMLLGSAGALGAEVVGFSGPINHMEARYGDWSHYTENYLPANQKDAFNKLNRDVQMAVANKIVANPSLSIEYVSNGKNAEGGYFDRVTGDIVINTDSPRAIEPLLAHEFTHYLEQTGGKRKFIDLLIGNPITGKPGIFVQRVTKENQSKYPDLKVGDPIMVGEGANRKFLLSDEFEQARTEYGKKLQDTLLDSEGNKMSDADLAKIMTDEQTVSEIVAEHGTDFLLNDPRRYRDKRRGTIGKIMGGILDTELVQNIPLLRQSIAMLGGTFRPDGRLITDNKLFSNLKRYPQITELVRKYNREIEGMSPQKKESLEQKGDIQGREIKSSGRSTKEVVVDIKSTELAKSPQLAELLRAGTLLQIDKDGNVIPNLAMTAREQGKYNRSFAEKLKEAIEDKEKNEGLPEGHVRPEVNPKTGNIRFVGRYLDDSVIDKLEKSGTWNKEQIQTLRDVNSNIRNKGGNEYLMTYFKAAGQGGGRYVNAKVENHIEVPYGFEITQKNNIILRTVSVNQLVKNIDQLARQQQGELTRLYGADIAQAKIKLLQDLDQYHRNHADGLPGKTGLDANQDIAKYKADFINSAFGTGTKDQAGSNPWRQSLGKKNPRDVYRSRRIERIGRMEQLSGTRFIDYDKINKAFIPAYHGTPHTFAPEPGAPFGKFRTSAIGTGEGAQAYGHGLYFAGKKEVAEHYRQNVKDMKGLKELEARLEGMRKEITDLRINSKYLKDKDSVKSEKLRKQADDLTKESRELSLKHYKKFTEPGSLYKVELAPKENEYLLWDKPLSEQPKGVREKLAKARKIEKRVLGAGVNKKEAILNVDDKFTKGGDVYKELATALTRERGEQDIRKAGGSAMGEQDALASQFLKEAGIPGIKYLDGSSRSKGEGDYNYVIFDEADVQITDKLFMPTERMGQLESGEGPVLKQVPIPTKSNIPSLKEIKSVISSEKKDKVGVNIEKGTPVGIRIDIPTFERTLNNPVSKTGEPTYAISVHQSWKGGKEGRAGRVIGYTNVTHIKNPKFNIAEKGAEKIRDGKISKTTIATVEGDWIGSQIPKGLESWTQVGMNPKRHSYYYDRATGEPVIGGTEAVNVGGTVFVKNAKFGNTKDFLFMPASEAGAGKGKQAEAAKLWQEKGTDSPYFKKYSGGAKIVKIGEQHDFVSGEPVVVEGVHGSTHTFKEFDPSKANPESDLGKAIYISNTPDEVGVNYAGEGPDLTGRIERKAETYMGMVEDELSSYGLSEDATQQQIEAKSYELARNELVGEGPQTYRVFAKFKNPVVVGEKFKSIDDFRNRGGKKETNFEMMFDEDAGTESGTLVDLLEQVDEVAYNFEFVDVDKVKSDIMEAADYDSIGAQELIKTMKESEGLMDTMDADGELANGEFVRQVFEGMGFDGIIDLSVNEKFGSQRKMGRSMEGMNPDTIHYLAFKPEQIKSATGNRGTFDAGERNINYMPSDPKAPTRQPANRITRQAPAMPGNRFMLPAVSAGAKSAERFR